MPDWKDRDAVNWLRETLGEVGDAPEAGTLMGLLAGAQSEAPPEASGGATASAVEEVDAPGAWAAGPDAEARAVTVLASASLAAVRYRIAGQAGDGAELPPGRSVTLPVANASLVEVRAPVLAPTVTFIVLS